MVKQKEKKKKLTAKHFTLNQANTTLKINSADWIKDWTLDPPPGAMSMWTRQGTSM